MQAFSNDPPFGRGVYQTFVTGTAAAEQFGYGILGCEWDFPDLLWDTGNNAPPTIRSSTPVRCRLVKNNTGSAILPKYLCKIDPADAGSITALTTATTDQFAPADEFLPAAGVPDKGLFWVVVRGSAKVITAATVLENIAAGDYLNASGVTTGTINIFDWAAVPTTATPFEAFALTWKNARARATANHTAAGGGGATITIQMTE